MAAFLSVLLHGIQNMLFTEDPNFRCRNESFFDHEHRLPLILLILHNPKRMKFNGLGKVGVIMMCAAVCSSFAW